MAVVFLQPVAKVRQILQNECYKSVTMKNLCKLFRVLISMLLGAGVGLCLLAKFFYQKLFHGASLCDNSRLFLAPAKAVV